MSGFGRVKKLGKRKPFRLFLRVGRNVWRAWGMSRENGRAIRRVVQELKEIVGQALPGKEINQLANDRQAGVWPTHD